MACYCSIVIPTRNRPDHLCRTLTSLAIQKYDQRDYEVIIIDNGSTDETRAVCQDFLNRFKNFIYFYEKKPGLHVCRNAGLKKSEGQILVYADDDIQASQYWLEAIAAAFKDKDAMLVGGKCLPRFENQPPRWLMDMWQKRKADGQILPFLSLLDLGDSIKVISPYYVFGCNFSIRRQVLLEAGGFHPDAMPPDLIRYRGDGETHVSKFISIKGYKTVYHPQASVYHYVSNERMTEQYLFSRFYAQGISDSYTHIRNSGLRFHRAVLALRAFKHLPLFCFNRLQARAYKAYISGYRFHQKEVRRDPELREWVNRENYLELR